MIKLSQHSLTVINAFGLTIAANSSYDPTASVADPYEGIMAEAKKLGWTPDFIVQLREAAGRRDLYATIGMSEHHESCKHVILAIWEYGRILDDKQAFEAFRQFLVNAEHARRASLVADARKNAQFAGIAIAASILMAAGLFAPSANPVMHAAIAPFHDWSHLFGVLIVVIVLGCILAGGRFLATEYARRTVHQNARQDRMVQTIMRAKGDLGILPTAPVKA